MSALTRRQREMMSYCFFSEPSHDVGWPLEGPDYTVARALERKGLGRVDSVGGSFQPLFWLNEAGIARCEDLAKETRT